MSLARYLASLLNSSGQVVNAKIADLAAAKVTGTLSDSQIAAMAASKLTGRVPDANAPSGSVIQVVSSTFADTYTYSNTNVWSPNFMSASITPSRTDSKILIAVHVGCFSYTSEVAHTASFRIVRDSTVVGAGTPSGSRQGASFRDFTQTDSNHGRNGSFAHLDSPNTTSSITYGVQVDPQGYIVCINRTGNDDNNSNAWGVRCASSITLTEIAA